MSSVSEITSDSHRRLLQKQISAPRLLQTVSRLVNAPSPTGSAKPAADTLADILVESGFAVECPIAGHPSYVGDSVLIPEYLNDRLPLAGRGGLIWRITFRRDAPPTHELLRGNEPNLLFALAECVDRVRELDGTLQQFTHPIAGTESAFIGQIHGGSLYNQAPQEVWLEGTRRWLPGTTQSQVERELQELAVAVGERYQSQAITEFKPMRGPFELDPDEEIVHCFQESYQAVSGQALAFGAKPFVDDGNTFSSLANIPAITHGPSGQGAHTENEWVSLPDLERVALAYALTAIRYCGKPQSS